MHIDPSELREFVENNHKFVMRKQSTKYPNLFVLKYTRAVFYDKLWNASPLLLECRGLVVDKDYNVVVKPFTKVFNYGENGTTIDRDEECTVVRKVNGFLGVVTNQSYVSDDLIYSTTGSLDSDFCDLIRKHVEPLKERIKCLQPCTLMFEICDHEVDPHIIPEEDGAWLIGSQGLMSDDAAANLKEYHLNAIAMVLDCHRPAADPSMRFSDVVKLANDCQHEGYMVYGNVSGTALKIKSPYYLVSKFLARMTPKNMAIIAKDKQLAYRNFDEEYYPLIDAISANADGFGQLTEQERLTFIRGFLRNK